ncbi:MAG: hypothetical protein A3C02_03450 [Candidatus Andersenbacteria bacterium RIFCSPHIGHO2_02_FULL_45_11]|uniref:Uncharacterized protein n=1 Tax=Candidatus Andersenbacteria bacterium RIFCSPHIGHO2_12_FULL_45_11 TaxID=1797281 RepID=A0A1G1X480_9BACT|nr:MAG: hypothetical protein A2805_03745 [Candidatus Andersenbacteria bacterium RIFCSPHIGHO2_01_FULL_46_36]OGY33491.1 MAG: hypothetical protein A3C02_03450 [Candidatus Andersenbacteria bacterium RIFCSPHIGHO2_02_FULL_45_11]OGY34809.1 MAG: hypothetical protein A3D99_01980 [Candidatus Andersenbacteria bacterium RIFCSPHIGHO2_12_FULL_45_11]
MEDLTVLYLTASEIKESFAVYQRTILLEAIGNYPLISVSRKPLDFGTNIIDDGKRSLSNIYRQMLRAAKMATTEFVATAEDDCLYHSNHFTFFRPKPDEFAYDQNRFALFTWGEPIYSWRNRKSNCSLIAPRKLLIEALEERFAAWPNGTPDTITGEVGRGMVERNLNITVRKSVEMFAEVSIIQFNHDNASEDRQVRHRKKLGQIKAYDLYYWGHAKNLRKKYEQ